MTEGAAFTGTDSLFGRLYFGVQALRGGVDRKQIRQAQNLLEASPEVLHEHVRSRLAVTHGAPDSALGWLDRQPLSDRADLRERMERSIETQPGRSIEIRRTSGSTGAPFRFVKDRQMTAMMDAVMWAVYAWHGIQPGQRHARFWGMPRARLPRARRRAMDFLLHRRRLDAFALSPETAERFFLRLRSFQPEYIHTYPNLLLEFVQYCGDAGMDGRELGVGAIVCGGELLPPSSRRKLEDYFEARVINEYGCSESGLISVECEFGHPHVLPIATYPQLVGSGEAPDGTLEGEVVVTDLYGSVVPLLRYQLHDRARMTSEPDCACGRSLASLSPVIGRIDSFIETPTKGRVYDAILAYSVPAEVLRFRAYQVDGKNLFVEAVLSSTRASERVLRNLADRWEKELGPGMNVKAVEVDEIQAMESGKLAYFIPKGDVPASVLVRAAAP